MGGEAEAVKPGAVVLAGLDLAEALLFHLLLVQLVAELELGEFGFDVAVHDGWSLHPEAPLP